MDLFTSDQSILLSLIGALSAAGLLIAVVVRIKASKMALAEAMERQNAFDTGLSEIKLNVEEAASCFEISDATVITVTARTISTRYHGVVDALIDGIFQGADQRERRLATYKLLFVAAEEMLALKKLKMMSAKMLQFEEPNREL